MEINTVTGNKLMQSMSLTAKSKQISGNSLPTSAWADRVDISYAGINQLNKSLQKGNQNHDSPQLVMGYEAMIGIGIDALGGEAQLKEWQEKGLEISDETFESAYMAYQQGFKELMNKRKDTSTGLALNQHQIVINNQDTPDWFKDEYQNVLSLMGNTDTQRAFKQGAIYHLSLNQTLVSKALSAYQAVL